MAGRFGEMSQPQHRAATLAPLNKDMKKRLIISVVGVVAVTASLAAYYRSNGTGGAPRYVMAAAARGDVVDTVEATGTLQAVTTVQVGSQVSGTISRRTPISTPRCERAT